MAAGSIRLSPFSRPSGSEEPSLEGARASTIHRGGGANGVVSGCEDASHSYRLPRGLHARRGDDVSAVGPDVEATAQHRGRVPDAINAVVVRFCRRKHAFDDRRR
jgi:hypothetical protein